MQWPTKYVRTRANRRANKRTLADMGNKRLDDANIPIDPTEKDPNKPPFHKKSYQVKHGKERNDLATDIPTQIQDYKDRVLYRDDEDDVEYADTNSFTPNGIAMYREAPASPSSRAVARKRVAPVVELDAGVGATGATGSASADAPPGSPVRAAAAAAEAAPTPTPASSPLSFSGLLSNGAARKKRATEAPSTVPETAPLAATPAPASASASASASARTVRALGEDDAMASIFSSGTSATSGRGGATSAAAGAPSGVPADAPNSAQRSFPRRSRDR